MKKGIHISIRFPKVTPLILSVLFSLFTLVGFSLEQYGQILRPGAAKAAVFLLVALSAFFYFTLSHFLSLFDKASRGTEKSRFRTFFILLLIQYLFYILSFYPGSVAHDTHSQLRQFLRMQAISNANPFAVTLFYGFFFKLGRFLSDPNFGVFLGCLAQGILMAYAFSKVCCFVRKTTGSKIATVVTFAFFFVVPIWGGAAQTLLKDSLHVSLFTLFFLQFIKLFEQEHSRKDILIFIFWMLAAAVSRKATFYIVLVCCLILVFYHQKKVRRFFLVLTAAFALVFFLYEDVVLPGIGIDKAPPQENYALQFQQVALVCVEHGDSLSEEDIAIIDSVLDYDKIREVYDPNIADPVKLLYHNDGSLRDFNRLHLRLMFRYPGTYLKSIVQSSWKYFSPLSEGYEYFRSYISPNSLGIYRLDEASGEAVLKWVSVWTEMPLLSLFIGPGLYTWLTIGAFAFALAKKNKKCIMTVLPMVIFTLGMLVTPVNGENRYAYPIMAAAPVLLACVWEAKVRTNHKEKAIHK
ncbi:MAG: hypothetical protein J6Q30_04275 [Oscillospiraceae bacterium]|nr:hypothetical protein [Oscillospiraceae bacterium]